MTLSLKHFSALLIAALLLRASLLFLSTDFNRSHEAMNLSGTLRLLEGKSLYPKISTTEAWVYPYQPLHAIATSILTKMSGTALLKDQVRVTRLFSLFCFTILAWLWLEWMKKFSVSKTSIGMTALLLLPRFADYVTVGRNDLLYLLLEFLALTVATRKSNFSLVAFSVAAFFTRQIPSPVLVGVLCHLLTSKKFFEAAKLLLLWVFSMVAIVFFLQSQTQTMYWKHIFEFAALGWKTQFFNFSFLSFLLCYGFFFFLSFLEFKDTSLGLLRWISLSSLGVGLIGYNREWSDSNFFLFSLLTLSPFCAVTLERLGAKPRLRLAIAIQFSVCALFYGTKAFHTWRSSDKDFIYVAEYLQSKYPEGGYITGPMNGSLTLHLKEWSKNGPDVASFVWPSLSQQHLPNFPGTLWVNVGENAENDAKIQKGVFGGRMPLECIFSWVCLYRL